MAYRSSILILGSATTLLPPLFLSTKVLGYYYSFAPLLGIQVFFELGINQVFMYKFAALRDGLVGSESCNQRLRILALAKILYLVLAFSFLCVALISGIIFFSRVDNSSINWKGPWVISVIATSANLYLSLPLTFLEANDAIHHVAVARMRTYILYSFIFASLIVSGAGIWVVCINPLVNAIAFTCWILFHDNSAVYRRACRVLPSLNPSQLLHSWLHEIFPLQWRFSLSWLSGYFIFQLYTPIVFSVFGSVAAGQLGLVIALTSSLSVVSTSIATANAPQLASFYSRSSYHHYNQLFDRSLVYSLVTLATLLFGFVLLVLFIQNNFLSMASRFPSISVTITYALCAFSAGISTIISVYLRSRQEDPLFLCSIVTALFMAIALFISSRYSIQDLVNLSLIVNILSTIWVVLVYYRKRHLPAPSFGR